MNSRQNPCHLRCCEQTTQRSRPIDERYQHYETLKSQLTAAARTSAEYDAAVREAKRLAGI